MRAAGDPVDAGRRTQVVCKARQAEAQVVQGAGSRGSGLVWPRRRATVLRLGAGRQLRGTAAALPVELGHVRFTCGCLSVSQHASGHLLLLIRVAVCRSKTS